MHTTFKEIKIHTAKCDECNKHNAATIYRCLDCSQQCCTPCWDKKGGDGTHLINTGTMTAQMPTILQADSYTRNKSSKKKRRAAKGKNKAKTDSALPLSKDRVEEDKEIDSNSNCDHSSNRSLSAVQDLVDTSKDQAKKANLIKKTSKGDEHSDAASSGAPSDILRVNKRKYVSANDTEVSDSGIRQYGWAFTPPTRTPTPGNKRIRTSNASNSTMHSSSPAPTEDEAAKDQAKTLEYAKYLIELSRGGLAGLEHLSTLSAKSDSPNKSRISPYETYPGIPEPRPAAAPKKSQTHLSASQRAYNKISALLDTGSLPPQEPRQKNHDQSNKSSSVTPETLNLSSQIPASLNPTKSNSPSYAAVSSPQSDDDRTPTHHNQGLNLNESYIIRAVREASAVQHHGGKINLKNNGKNGSHHLCKSPTTATAAAAAAAPTTANVVLAEEEKDVSFAANYVGDDGDDGDDDDLTSFDRRPQLPGDWMCGA